MAVLCIWVSFILVARGSARASLTEFDIVALRFAFSGLVVLPFAWHFRHALLQGLAGGPAGAGVAADAGALRRAAWRGAALAATGGVGYSLLAYSAFFRAPVSHAAVLMPGCLPLWSTVWATVLLGERLTLQRVAGLVLILAGGAAVAGSSLLEAFGGHGTWRGDALFVAAAICWALYGVLCRRWRIGAMPATATIALLTLFAAVPLHALAVASGLVPSRLAQAPWGEIAFQAAYQGGLAMLVAGTAFTQVVAHYGPVRTTMITAIVPPLAALAAVPMLGEPLSPSALVGLAFVTAGLLVGMGLIGGPRPPREAAA